MGKRKIEIFTAVLCGLIAGSVITKVPGFSLVSGADSNYSFDVNGDGSINVMDLICLKTYLLDFSAENNENSENPSVITSPGTESSPQPNNPESGKNYKLEEAAKLNIPGNIRKYSEDESIEESEKNIAEVQNRIYTALVEMGMDKDISVIYKKYYNKKMNDNENKNKQGLDVITATLAVPNGEYGIDAVPLKKFIKSTGQSSYGDSTCIETYGKINVEIVTDKDDNIVFVHFYDAGYYYDENEYDYSHGFFSDYIYENSSDVPDNYTNAIANDLLSRSVLHFVEYQTSYMQKYKETDTEYIAAILPEGSLTEEYEAFDVLLDNNCMNPENIFFVSVDKSSLKVTYRAEKRQSYYGTFETAKNIVREFLNEDIDQSAYCEINSEKEYFTSIDYPVYETLSSSFGTKRISRVHIGFSSADEKTKKVVYARLAGKCGQITETNLLSWGIDVFLMNDRIVNCCICNYYNESYRNYYTFSYVRSKNTNIVDALDKYFGNDVKSRICFYESICRYATYSNNKVSYNSGYTESDGKLKYTQLSDELISVSIEIPELYGLNRVYNDNNEIVYPCKYANGDEIKPGNIKFIINTRTKSVEKIASTN